MTDVSQSKNAPRQDIQPLPTASRQEGDIKNFDDNMKKFLNLAIEIHTAAYGSMSNQKLWFIRIQKFLSAYTKAKNPKGFMDMWTNFYTQNSKDLNENIFVEVGDTTEVNDKWLKDTTDREKKGASKLTGWNHQPQSCNGVVVYCDPKVPSVSVPITEIYLAAIKLSKDKGNDNIKFYGYPAHVLLCIYSILNSCVPGKQKINRNMKTLRTFLDEITAGDGSEHNDAIGEGISGFSKIMSTVIKTMGFNVNIDDKKIEETFREAFNSDTAKNVTKAIGKVMDNVNSKKSESGTDAMKNVIDGIGSAWNDPEIKNLFAGAGSTEGVAGGSRTSVIDDADRPAPSACALLPITLPMVTEGGTPDYQE